MEHVSKKRAIDAAPVLNEVELSARLPSNSSTELSHNLVWKEVSRPIQGPQNPFSVNKQLSHRNIMTGLVQDHFIDANAFNSAQRSFDSFGHTLDPNSGEYIAAAVQPAYVKQDREDKGDASLPNFKGPWAAYKTLEPEVEQIQGEFIPTAVFDKSKLVQERIMETTTFHGKEKLDYLGRSFLHPPMDVGVDLRGPIGDKENFIPKQLLHTWTGHTKPVTVIRFFPKSAHMILSGAMDGKIKIWDVYGDRQVKRTYMGHTKGIKDISFNNDGTKFLSCSYDRWIKLWDTETGDCIARFSCKKIPNCVVFNPDPEKQHLFLMGCQDKKIYQYDMKSGDIVQTYDQHNGGVNTITFMDEGRRFLSTSDDKTLRAWEWDIPVVIKYVSESDMHSLPAASLSNDKKWLACQSLDNKVVIYSVSDRIKLNKKKLFNGHLVAGYTSKPGFSPDGRFVMSGDCEGKMWFWDWKTCKVFKKFQAHQSHINSCLWHPYETSRVVTCSNDGTIKYWD